MSEDLVQKVPAEEHAPAGWDSLRRSVNRLADAAEGMASKEFVQEVQESEAEKRRTFGLAVIVVGVCFMLMFGLMLYGLITIQNLSADNKRLNTSARSNTDTLISCLLPSEKGDRHACYETRNKIGESSVSVILERIRQLVREEVRQALLDAEKHQKAQP